MDQIAAMRTFIKVVECQSFTKAAHQLGISVAMTSKLMQQLEESLSTRLLSRTPWRKPSLCTTAVFSCSNCGMARCRCKTGSTAA